MRFSALLRYWPALALFSVAPLVALVGCTPDASQQQAQTESSVAAPPAVAANSNAATDEHAHKSGAHGGLIVSIGLDSYHAEAVFEKGGQLKLLMLGQDESRIVEVELQTLKAYVKAAGSAEAASVDLLPTPQEGDAEGKTSQFTAQLPEGLAGQELDITIPNIRINGERFRIGFTSRQQHPQEHQGMPNAVAASEEQQLYLTPGGKYTLDDIKANGNVTASQKFKGLVSNHNLMPAVGDKICPITTTKANPQFTWVIDGQPYEFCCPPCVDEFVKMGKEKPEELQPANSYVKK